MRAEPTTVIPVMSDPLGLSIGTTNLVAARVGNQPLIRRSVLTLSADRTPQVGAPADGHGVTLAGFVERVGDPVPLVAPDGASYLADALLVEALDAMVDAAGGPSPQLAIAVPAHWGAPTLRALRSAMRTNPNLSHDGMPARLVSDAVASLTALRANPGLPLSGVVALLDFGGGGTSITLADAGASFEPIDETTRYADFSGDQIDQALLTHVLDGVAQAGGIEPAGTTAVGSLARLREECRQAKERLSAETATDLMVELPGYSATVRVTRAELETLMRQPLAGALTALETALERNGIGWPAVAAVVTIGGGANIPLVTQQLSEHSQAQVVTTPQPALDAAIGGALAAAYSAEAEVQTGVAPTLEATAATPIPDMTPQEPDSSTFRALAWSQDDTDDDVVPYTGPDLDSFGTHTAARPTVHYVPRTGPIEEPRSAWQKLPVAVFGVAAALVIVAIGGVTYALTSATDTATTSVAPPPPPQPVTQKQAAPVEPPPPSAAPPPPPAPVTEAAPPPAPVTEAPPPPPPPQTETRVVTVTSTPPPPPPTHTTTTTTTTTETTTTTPPTTTTTTPTTTTTTTNPMTTTYITVPFVPVPIPIQVPNTNPTTQQPQYPYQQNPYQPQYPYQQQNPYGSPYQP